MVASLRGREPRSRGTSTVRSCYQAVQWRPDYELQSVCDSDLWSVVTSCAKVFNKSDYQSKNPFIVTLSRDYIYKYILPRVPGLVWLILMGSRFDDWIYWHFFIITVNYNSTHIELLLHDVCLTHTVWRISRRSLYRLARIHENPCKLFVVTKNVPPETFAIKEQRF
jgi:hypothetical protein